MIQIQMFNEECLAGMAKLESSSIDMVLADPPYGTTQCEWDSVIDLGSLWAQLRRVCKPNAAIVLNAAQPFTTALISSNLRDFRYCWYWQKNNGTGFLNAKIQPLRVMEDVVVFYRESPTYNPQMRPGKPYVHHRKTKPTPNYNHFDATITVCEDGRYPINHLSFSSDRGKHSTQKPVALMEYLVRTYTHEGQTVLDFCFGSGTAAVACQNLGRSFVGFETSPDFFAIAQDRLDS